jgi:hypothetical protein
MTRGNPSSSLSLNWGFNKWAMENTKKCTKCGRELCLERFYERKLKGNNIGYHSWCKDCSIAAAIVRAVEWHKNNPEKARIAVNKWRNNNPEKAKAATAKWRRNNPDKIRAAVAKWQESNPRYKSEWKENNPGYQNNYERNRMAIDHNFKLIKKTRTAMYMALIDNAKSGHTTELLGCSIEELRNHLERLFLPGMSWDNYGMHGWHIDHIIPVSYFDFTDPEQQKRAWHYTNLQPLWAEDNLKKSNKIQEVQLILL